MRDPAAAPWLLVIAIFALPFAVAGLAGMMAFRRMTPLAYRCGRAFPTACPRCRARDWNGSC